MDLIGRDSKTQRRLKLLEVKATLTTGGRTHIALRAIVRCSCTTCGRIGRPLLCTNRNPQRYGNRQYQNSTSSSRPRNREEGGTKANLSVFQSKMWCARQDRLTFIVDRMTLEVGLSAKRKECSVAKPEMFRGSSKSASNKEFDKKRRDLCCLNWSIVGDKTRRGTAGSIVKYRQGVVVFQGYSRWQQPFKALKR